MELLPRGNERNNISFFVVSEDKEDKEKRLSLVVTPKALFVEIVLVLFAFVIEEAKEIAETLLLMRKDIFVIQSSSREGKKVTHFLRTFLTQNNAKVFALLSLESIRLKLERKRRRGETRRESRFFLRGRSKKTDDDA